MEENILARDRAWRRKQNIHIFKRRKSRWKNLNPDLSEEHINNSYMLKNHGSICGGCRYCRAMKRLNEKEFRQKMKRKEPLIMEEN